MPICRESDPGLSPEKFQYSFRRMAGSKLPCIADALQQWSGTS
jgi:hypothetical protein